MSDTLGSVQVTTLNVVPNYTVYVADWGQFRIIGGVESPSTTEEKR